MRSDLAYTDYLATQKKRGLARTLVACSRPDARTITLDGRDYINFSSNDYLGLTHHPLVKERAALFLKRFGAGTGASRLVTGNIEPFDEIEQKLAQLKGVPASLIFASGFQANATILQALFDRKILKAEPLVFADRLNHSSMHFGCASAGIQQQRYRHLDLAHLGELLEKHAQSEQPKFILSESVFSMDGDVADMMTLRALATRHDCQLICDDAHATGILGEQGAGLSRDADLVIGTFSKALGGFGAFLAGSELIKDYVINRCAGFIYSTAPAPAILGAMDAAIDLLPSLDDERAHVARLARMFRSALAERELDFGKSSTQIVPVILGSSSRVMAVSAALRGNGLWVTPIRPPTVPKGAARLRVTFNAAHRPEDVEKLVVSLDHAIGKA